MRIMNTSLGSLQYTFMKDQMVLTSLVYCMYTREVSVMDSMFTCYMHVK